MTRSARAIAVYGTIILVLLASTTGIFSSVAAQGDNKVVVDTGRAHIRSGPSPYTTSLGSVPGGTELPVTGRNSGSTWWRVDSSFGEGWISSELVAFRGIITTVPIVSEPAGIPEVPTVVIDRLPATVYRNPNADSFVVGIAPTGAILTVIGLSTDGQWWQVETIVGVGFVQVADVAFRGDPKTVPSVNDPGPTFDGPTIRANADTPVSTAPGGGEVIGTLTAGTALPAGGRTADNSWWQIADAFGIGWIPVSNVSLAGAASNIQVGSNVTTPGPAYSGAAFATILIESQRKIAYFEASYDSPPMWDAFLGEQLSVTARSLDGLWLEVVKDGYVGWMNFSGITLQGNMAGIPPLDTTPPPVQNRVVVNTAWLNIRSGPDVKYERIGAGKGGDVLPVSGRHPNLPWIRVAGDFGTGWINNEFVVFRGDWPAVPVVDGPIGDLESPVAYIEVNHNVYGAPDWNTQTAILPPGLYVIVGWNNAYTWALIDSPEGEVWIHYNEFLLRGIAQNAPIVAQ